MHYLDKKSVIHDLMAHPKITATRIAESFGIPKDIRKKILQSELGLLEAAKAQNEALREALDWLEGEKNDHEG